MPTGFKLARLLALLVPSALMLGALGSQYVGGLYPCEMCHWQRWPHEAAIVLALFAFAVKGALPQRLLVALAALAILTSAVIGFYHAGVEYGWFDGLTKCSTVTTGEITLESIMKTPMIRCDVAQWSLFGVSLAGFNALISGAAGLAILWFAGRREVLSEA